MTYAFSMLFFAALLLSGGLRLWLMQRQSRYVRDRRDRVPEGFADAITLHDHRRAADYSRAKLPIGMAETLAESGLLLFMTLGGGLAALVAWLASALDGYAFALALFAALGLVNLIIDQPFALYRTFVLEARFGFNKTTPRLFIGDLVKQTLLSLLIGAPLLSLIVWLMTRMGEHWWWSVWLAWLGFNLLLLLLYPTFIAPLFNRFAPLPESDIKQRIEALLARCGFSNAGLFVMDGSKRSAHGNAYFTGFGRSKRIVFFDTLLDTLTPGEVEAVLAHELGHYRHRHVWKRIAGMAAISLALLWLLGLLMNAPWFYAGLGVPLEKVGAGGTALAAALSPERTALALLLFSLVLPVFGFPLTPLFAWLSRRHEFEADAYAARQASATDLVAALLKLYRDNAATLTPDPLHSLFYDSHPPAAVRIAHLQAGTR